MDIVVQTSARTSNEHHNKRTDESNQKVHGLF